MHIPINTFVERFKKGEFDSDSRAVQCEAGWYDWFCRDSALQRKTAYLGKKVCDIATSKRFDPNKSYVFFKNNCPMVGKLYDSFSISDLATNDVLFCCQHLEKGSHGCDRAHWEIYDAKKGFKMAAVSGTWKDVKSYFLNA